MNDEHKKAAEGLDGGIYEPIRRMICGPGPCEGEDLEKYREAYGVIKKVEDAIAAQCFNMGVESFKKRVREELESVMRIFREADDRAEFTISRNEFFNKLLSHDGEEKNN